MSLWDGLARATAEALAASLSVEQRQRGTALIVAKAAKPDADASDLMILANYVVTGFEIIPEPKDDPYPYPSGDVTVLGPQIFASTAGPDENSVISWRGENFVPQWDRQPAADEHPDDPGPVPPDPDDEDAVSGSFDTAAPMAGAHWQGRRGGNRTG